jgi:ribokinase
MLICHNPLVSTSRRSNSKRSDCIVFQFFTKMANNAANTTVQRPKFAYSSNISTETAKVAVVGSLNLDFINYLDSHPARGSHVRAKRVVVTPGGHGANQAVACARLSDLPLASTIREVLRPDESFQRGPIVDVSMIGAVGDKDDYGDRITAELNKNNVNTDEVLHIKGEKTGYAHINVNAVGEATVTFAGMANDKFLPGPAFKLEVVPDVVLVQLEIPMETVRHVLAWAKRQNAITVCNAAPATRTIPPEIFQVDHFIINEEQADTLDGFETKIFKDRTRQRSELRQHYLEQCDQLHDCGATCVIVTLAELGVVGSRKDPKSHAVRRYIFDAELGPMVKDTTGGSDAFVGAYTIEIVHQMQLGMKQDMASAIEMGIKAAGLCVSRDGSMCAIPSTMEILTTNFFVTQT